eukprot:2728478-Rhodomonas_salina.3
MGVCKAGSLKRERKKERKKERKREREKRVKQNKRVGACTAGTCIASRCSRHASSLSTAKSSTAFVAHGTELGTAAVQIRAQPHTEPRSVPRVVQSSVGCGGSTE